MPILAGREGGGQPLERIPLTPEGKGAFDETWLQCLIHENPACLPISEIEPALDPFTAICREMQTPRGYIDNLLMTGRGDIALVETKLFRNPEARRDALAQALDYATSLFEMGYEAFAKAALDGTFAPRPKPASLYAALPEAEKLPEDAFADAVSRNLRLGRVLILVVGDGIREETERLIEGLQAYARFGFALALVELGVFRMPGESDRFLIRPRTLAKTSIIRRTIVEVTGAGTTKIREQDLAAPETLSAESYWDALEAKVPGARAALEKLIHDVEPLGVYPDFLKTLNFKWARPGFKPVNLGYVYTHGAIWTDLASWLTDNELGGAYVRDVAAAFGCEAHAMPTSGNLTPYKDGKPLNLASVVTRLDAWVEPMRRFIAAIQAHDAKAQ